MSEKVIIKPKFGNKLFAENKVMMKAPGGKEELHSLEYYGDLEVSDGYHTFEELYDHRITLFIALCKIEHSFEVFGVRRDNVPLFNSSYQIVSNVWRSKVNGDGSVWDGWFIIGIGRVKGTQITYHLPLDRWEETNFADTLDRAPEWDGHSPADVLLRLKKL